MSIDVMQLEEDINRRLCNMNYEEEEVDEVVKDLLDIIGELMVENKKLKMF